MKKEQNKDNAITKTDLVFIVGLALFAYPTWMGLKFVRNDDVLSVLISILHIALLCMFVYGLKKIKTVETNFKTWKWVEIFLLLVFIVSLLLFINVPMNRTFEVFSQSKDLKIQAEKELIEIEKKIKEFKDKEEIAITEVCNRLGNALGSSTDSAIFDKKSKNYVNHFVIKSDNGGTITEKKIDDYKKLLTNKLNDIIKEEIVPYEIECKEMKERNGWNVINLYEILDYSKKLDTLYNNVGTKLTNSSKLCHSETEYHYKFKLEKSDNNSFTIGEPLEYNYNFENDNGEKKQSDFKPMFDNIIYKNDFKNNFNIISLVIIIMILFPYLMANRSTKVMIKRMYDKNNKDLGGQDL